MRRIALLAWLSATGCGTELLHGLDERQANEVCDELETRGIAADKTGDDRAGTFKVSVARPEAARALSVLKERDLPREGGKGVGQAFADPGLLPSPTAERARLSASLAVDLERTLEAIPGVTTARVHLALPDVDPLRAEDGRPRVTAAVLLRTRSVLTLGSDELKRMIAGAVEGLQPEGVTLAPASRAPALFLLSGALLLIGLLSAAVVALALRLRALRGPTT